MTMSMTIPLWCLAAFVLLALILVLALTWARLRHLSSGGTHRDFGRPDDNLLIWRLFRAHSNALENLPLFASLVLIGSFRGISGAPFDTLSVVYIVARAGQSLVHVLPGAGVQGFRRPILFWLQLACLAGLLFVVVQPN